MDDAPRILRFAGALDGAIASLGECLTAPSSILDAPEANLRSVIDSYVLAHFAVARAVLPALRERAGVHVLLNGALAYSASYPGAGNRPRHRPLRHPAHREAGIGAERWVNTPEDNRRRAIGRLTTPEFPREWSYNG